MIGKDKKQFAPACDRNQTYIDKVLSRALHEQATVLEISSGTGQHASYFASRHPGWIWQPADLPEQHASIRAWKAECGAVNVLDPIKLDLVNSDWSVDGVDAVVCINTIHIVSWPMVETLFHGVGHVLTAGGVFYVYGPYRYHDQPLAPSNEQFDHWLRARDPQSGIRDFEAVDAIAQHAGLLLEGDEAMPANNRSIWWRKT